MPSTFQARYFADVNLNDPFFDSLKADYPEFELWFKGKAEKGTNALVYLDGDKIGAFIYLKQETEEITLQEGVLPAIERIKIGTLKLDESIRNKRLGEGALGLCLWHWRDAGIQQIYVTVYSKQEALINFLKSLVFIWRDIKKTMNVCISKIRIKSIYLILFFLFLFYLQPLNMEVFSQYKLDFMINCSHILSCRMCDLSNPRLKMLQETV